MRVVDTGALAAARVSNVHGAAGTTWWLQVVGGHALRGPWEAVELAAVPPGGVSGLHRHTRTSEIYYGLRGSGVLTLDGRRWPFARGAIAFTGTGSVHGLDNTGDRDLHWLVIEVPARAGTAQGPAGAAAAARPRGPGKDQAMRTAPGPLSMEPGASHDLLAEGADPFHSVGLMALEAGERRACPASGQTELFALVVDGEVSVAGDPEASALGPGVALTLPMGEGMTLEAMTAAHVFWVRALVEWRR